MAVRNDQFRQPTVCVARSARILDNDGAQYIANHAWRAQQSGLKAVQIRNDDRPGKRKLNNQHPFLLLFERDRIRVYIRIYSIIFFSFVSFCSGAGLYSVLSQSAGSELRDGKLVDRVLSARILQSSGNYGDLSPRPGRPIHPVQRLRFRQVRRTGKIFPKIRFLLVALAILDISTREYLSGGKEIRTIKKRSKSFNARSRMRAQGAVSENSPCYAMRSPYISSQLSLSPTRL